MDTDLLKHERQIIESLLSAFFTILESNRAVSELQRIAAALEIRRLTIIQRGDDEAVSRAAELDAIHTLIADRIHALKEERSQL